MPQSPHQIQTIGVDTGGTFTDIVIVDESGRIRADKRPSVPADPARPVLEGLPPESSGGSCRVVHGTTVATNALLEHKIARAALITTAGFEDILEIGRQNRPALYEMHPRKPPALIPRDLCFGIKERILHDGSIRTRPEIDEIRDLLESIKSRGVESIAVCLLHSYVNPIHERIIGERAREMGFMVSLSCEVLPEFREYERTATLAVNACLRPVMQGYLGRLEHGMGGRALTVMQSAGGIIPSQIAARLPVHTVLSGPAGGVIAAAEKARVCGTDRLITFDMGGTSTDVSLYDRGPSLSAEKVIAGHPIRVPVMDIHTVGAGGGSIAFQDAGGSLKVGPVSAGADPGPICYGQGNDVTVTDANLFLGRLEPDFFLGGKMEIFPDRVPPAMERLAESLGLDAVQTAEGIITVANAVMERAIRVISIERGNDPGEFTLMSFGGAGGLHAVELARSLNIPSVTIPPDAGVFSAYGMVVADVTRDFSRTILQPADQLTDRQLESLFSEMIQGGVRELEGEGIDPAAVTALRFLDMRYERQSHEITIPLSHDPAAAFHGSHEKLYGYGRPDSRVEIVTIRARLIAVSPRPEAVPSRPRGKDPLSALISTRPLVFERVQVEAGIYDRERLRAGHGLKGPALVVESTSTTFLPPDSKGRLDEYHNLVISPG